MALKLKDREVETPEVLARPRYGIWGLAVVFVLLAGLALLVVLFLPAPQSETVELPSKQPVSTVPTADGGSDGSVTSVVPGGAPAGSSKVTVPGGAPAPEGVTKVLATGGSTSFSFEVPTSFRNERVRAAVPPATAVANGDGTQLLVTVNCSLVRNEVLAQVALSEGDSVVTVLPVVLVPEKGDPCPAGTQIARVVLPLSTPLGTRQVFVAPEGTEVPTPG